MKAFCLTLSIILAAAYSGADEEIILSTDDGKLAGTLVGEPGENEIVVLIHPGSGPTDRDGNSAMLPGKNNSLRLVADLFATAGIASLRIDKRGIGSSHNAGRTEQDLRFETYIEDTISWIEELRRLGFRKVVVLGHSEGSLICMVAARRTETDGFISVAGPSEKAADVIREQLRPQLDKSLMRKAEEALDQLENGNAVDEIPAGLESLFRPSVQPYMISWFDYDPESEISKLSVPVLIVQGSTDIQVSSAAAKALGRKAKNADVKSIDGMNHVLKEVESDSTAQMSSYTDPDLPLHPELKDVLVDFVKSLE